MTSVGVVVEDIPRGLSVEVIKQYLFSKGGEIRAFHVCEGGKKARVEFEDTGVIAGILSSTHKIGRHIIKVAEMDEEEVYSNQSGNGEPE
jgi:hypothetical protein